VKLAGARTIWSSVLEWEAGDVGKYCIHGERKSSGWEKLLCRYLCKEHIRHEHQPYEVQLRLESGRTITFRPDILVGGTIIEPHGIVGDTFIAKMRAFRRRYPDLKVILVVKNNAIPRLPEELYDEVIPIEHYDLLRQVLRRRQRGKGSESRLFKK
jgi:hypothetical protein